LAENGFDTIFLEAQGIHLSVVCQEEVPFNDPNAVRHEADAFEGLTTLDLEPAVLDECGSWGVPKGETIVHQPVRSDIPALVASGEYDPITRPSGAERASETLANSFYFAFPAVGHGVMFASQDCGGGMARQFMDNPTTKPDASCISDMQPIQYV